MSMEAAASGLGFGLKAALFAFATLRGRGEPGTVAARGGPPPLPAYAEPEPIALVAEDVPHSPQKAPRRLAPDAERMLRDIGMPRDVALAVFLTPNEAASCRARDTKEDAARRFVVWLRALDLDEEARTPTAGGRRWCGEYSAEELKELYCGGSGFCAYDRREPVPPDHFLEAMKATAGVRYQQLVKNGRKRTYAIVAAPRLKATIKGRKAKKRGRK